jgi:uncharacterized protein
MDFVLGLLKDSVEKVVLTFVHNWPFLLARILVAALLKLFVDARKVSAFLQRYRGVGVAAATAAAVGTPLCSCGTTAVVLGMMATTMPWAPIVAFMVASPLSSPEGLVYSAGLFGWPFAVAFFVVSILLGLAGGAVASVFERKGWLVGQARLSAAAPTAAPNVVEAPRESLTRARVSLPAYAPAERGGLQLAACCAGGATAAAVAAPATAAPAPDCGCAVPNVPSAAVPSGGCACAAPPIPARRPFDAPAFLKEVYRVGKQLLVMFLGFAFIGYVLNGLIPAHWVAAIFGAGHAYSVPLAATLGLPLYINSEASLPLIRALLDSGMSQGAAMAFLITGAGTSIGAIAGALTIARWRVIALVVGVLWIGAIIAGYGYDLLLALKAF